MHSAPLNLPLIGLKAISGHCEISVSTLRKWIKEEAFPAAKSPCWMTTTGKIAQWIEKKVDTRAL